ncbi:MAG TPA: hypothetical protein VGF65_11290 [Mycobacterium sp.]|jgi:hypothetical protein
MSDHPRSNRAVPPDTPGAPDFSITNQPTPKVTLPPPTPSPVPAPAAQPQPIFARRKIDVTFTLGTGKFTETNSSTIKVTGLRCSVSIAEAGMTGAKAHVMVWGLTFDQMNKLSTLGLQYAGPLFNMIAVDAGDDDSGMTRVFEGQMTDGYLDGAAQPAVAFQLTATSSKPNDMKPVPPTSAKGPVDVAGQMKIFAQQAGLKFENAGVTGVHPTIYLPGTLGEQMKSFARHANIAMTIRNGTLRITPKTGPPVPTGGIPLVSPGTGMVGYPAFASNAIKGVSVFNPLIRCQDWIKIDSSLKAACGQWRIIELGIELESQRPNGSWFSSFTATREVLRPGTGTS